MLIGEKKTNYGIVRKSESLFKSKLPLHGANKNYFVSKIGIQFSNTTLLVKKLRDRNWKCLHRLWFRLLIKKILLKISNLKKLLVWCHNLVKLVIKEKWMYSGYIAFDGRGLRSFGYDSFRNIVHLDLDNSSSFHPDGISFRC